MVRKVGRKSNSILSATECSLRMCSLEQSQPRHLANLSPHSSRMPHLAHGLSKSESGSPFSKRNRTRRLQGRSLRGTLAAMLKHVRKGDVVICHSIEDRLARNLDDLRRLVLGLRDKPIPASSRKIYRWMQGASEPSVQFRLHRADKARNYLLFQASS